jgi:histone H3/H4
MEEERHSSSEERQQQLAAAAAVASETKVKRPRISYIRDVCDLPQTKMRALLKAAFPEFNIEEDALIALTKAAELIVQDLATGANKQAKSVHLVKYEHIAEFVRNDRRRAIAVLRDIFPPRRTFGDIKKVVLNVKDDDDED